MASNHSYSMHQEQSAAVPPQSGGARNKQMLMMEHARNGATFDSAELAVIIFGSKQAVDIHNAAFERVEAVLGTHDMSKLPLVYAGTDREAQLLEGLRTGKAALEDCMKYHHIVFHNNTLTWSLSNACPFGIHTLLFVPFLKSQMGDEQLAYWLPLAEAGKITGAFAQTEMGHGSFVGGIETTATYDCEADEFVIHSPNISSTKYWPGALGLTSSHAIVMARLILGYEDLGVHPFMVQLRSLDDFKPLPGIELGDIGTKMAYNGTDNGYAIFKHVHIPRTNMFNRHASVSRDGCYKKEPLREKLMYGGMMKARGLMARNAAFQLAQAATIAARYSVVREQGRGTFGDGFEEKAIIQYGHQRYRLFSIISQAYATLFAWKTANTTYQAMLGSSNLSTLAYHHALLCGMKAWSTKTAADGAEEARKMCGGHGYMSISGLPEISTSTGAACTFEGENWVMWQQVAMYLMKGVAAPTLPADMEYLCATHISKKQLSTSSDGAEFLNHEVQLRIFQHRAARLICEASELLDSSELSKDAAWNKHMMILTSAARAHTEVHIVSSFMAILSTVPDTLHCVLSRLLSLFTLTTIVSPLATNTLSFLESTHLSATHLSQIRTLIDHLLDELAPNVIALTDAWMLTDASLASALGCRDGNVYERILNWTRQLPINVKAGQNGSVFVEGFEGYIKHFIRAKL